ncbi:MAG: SDR family NAD(P)-dependent oxidoreductase, partial [Acidimicrobiales bacterium]|nr:SDR family NAD(P)-dependent oxidoreductase [Acidimicrobiales bacterium]
FVPRMLAQDTPGHIVNTASVAAFVTAPASAPYVVSKGAALSLTECLAHDLATVGSKLGASVRPERYGADNSDSTKAVAEALASMTSAGLAPEAAVAPVIDAIRNDTFLIGTKPSLDQQLASRAQALGERRLPPVSIVD